MKLQTYTIAKGNKTLLISGCPTADQVITAKQYLSKVEQVGFIPSDISSRPSLTMMGGELCINALLAYSFYLSKNGYVYSSGLKNEISYTNINGITSITMELPYKSKNNIILLSGIGYIIVNKNTLPSKKFLSCLANKYNMPAFGQIFYKNERITPYVYVTSTDSLVKETACGSGSIATNIMTGVSRLQQPSGGYIYVQRRNTIFTITSQVERVSL